METFERFNFNKQILNAIADAGYEEPTPIQLRAIPPILNGQDLMGIAQTGTGKTAAYILPILMKLKFAQDNVPRALILAPTRELAMQINEELAKFVKYTDLRHTAIYGGLGPKTQKEKITAGLDILVATPGRFLDLYLSGDLIVKKIGIMVLDEADKMLDMGFIGSINRILEVVPTKKQNLLFSATMSPRVQDLAGNFLKFPVTIEVERQATPVSKIDQHLFYVPNIKTKIRLLEHLISDAETFSRVIIFCKTRQIADQVFKFLERKCSPGQVRVIHANKGQNTRINSMADFKDGVVRLLVSTDVAARGIDITDVSHVINFDVPLIYEDYVHRIGRTARANKSGVSITFCNDAEKYHLEKIQKLIRSTIPVFPIPDAVKVEDTPFEEMQAMLREIDMQKRKDNPEFQGAFHEKKQQNKKDKRPDKSKNRRGAKSSTKRKNNRY